MGLLGGAGYNVHSQDLHYLTDYRIQGAPGLHFGLTGQYDLTDWFGLRMDVTFTQKNYRQFRAELSEMNYRYRNDYLLVPVLASFRFGGARSHPGSLDTRPVREDHLLRLSLEDAGVGGDGTGEPDVAADDRVLADGDAAEDGGIGIHRHAVFQDRVTGNVPRQAVGIV